MKAWRESNKGERAAYNKAYCEANKDKRAAYRKKYYEANKDKVGAWREVNKDKIKSCSNAYVKKRRRQNTGWTPEQYEAKFAEQGGRCAICEAEPREGGKALAADHCHKTGVARGLLCTGCNLAIGILGDDLKGIMRAVRYLTRYGDLKN
jgi:hypothetical protein